ncbi:LysE family translocator, partial [Bacillus cereus]|uniref:LysE family translocator n=2 Tax=Bacillus TaxID=1386 RepID=UPI002AC206E5
MNLIAFLSYLIITSITPGPSNILMMNEARKFGFKGSIHFQFGIISGFIILGLITSLLITRIYHWIPMLESYFKIGGAIYLLYLAWKIAFSKKSNNDTSYSQPSFVSGLLFQILNLKSILYFLTAM